MDVAAAFVADVEAAELWIQAKLRSTTQRQRPSPEPCSVWRRAMRQGMPRWRRRRRYFL